MQLPHELILQLIAASDAVETWLAAMEEQTKCSTLPASLAARDVENSILDLIADDEFGDELFCSANSDWPCFELVRKRNANLNAATKVQQTTSASDCDSRSRESKTDEAGGTNGVG